MDFDLSEEQRMLLDHASDFLAERSPPARLRQLIDGSAEWDAELWREAAEMGFLGVSIPESYGGLGLGWLDMAMVSQAMGRANAALPIFSSCVLAAQAILLAGDDAQKARWLPGLASGEIVGCFAYDEGVGAAGDDALPCTVADGRLHGAKQPVADAGVANIAVVLAQRDGRSRLAVVELDQPQVGRTRLDSFDQLRAHHAIRFEGAACSVLEGTDEATIERLFDRAAVQAAFEAIGGTSACLDMACAYAQQRMIFGRALASYQAVKHKLADILVGLELAQSSAFYAALVADTDPDQLPAAAASARLVATDAFEHAARENMQVHGGISYTFEADCHFYYRRERAHALSLGGRSFWARRLAAALDAGSETA